MVDVANSKAMFAVRNAAQRGGPGHRAIARRPCGSPALDRLDQRFDDLAELINQPIGEETDA